MTSERNDLRPELPGLRPPPRDVALGLRCRLLSGPGGLIAAGGGRGPWEGFSHWMEGRSGRLLR